MFENTKNYISNTKSFDKDLVTGKYTSDVHKNFLFLYFHFLYFLKKLPMLLVKNKINWNFYLVQQKLMKFSHMIDTWPKTSPIYPDLQPINSGSL